VLVDDLLELRNLRMAVRSGGLCPVDEQDFTEQIVTGQGAAIGGRPGILVLKGEVWDDGLGDSAVIWPLTRARMGGAGQGEKQGQ
jgi:hypothetical protein